MKELVTSTGTTIGNVNEEGISLSIPPGAVDESMEIVVRSSICCPMRLPDGCIAASPVYFIDHKKEFRFQHAVGVEILHYIDLENSESRRLVFMTSSQKDSTSAYIFTRIDQEEVTIDPKSQVAKIMLTHFSPVMVGSYGMCKTSHWIVLLSYVLHVDDILCSVRLYREIPSSEHKAVICVCKRHPHYREVNVPSLFAIGCL